MSLFERKGKVDDASVPWERGMLEKLAQAGLSEQRRARRWGIFFKLATLLYLLVFLGLLGGQKAVHLGVRDADHTAIIDVKGVIADGDDSSADNLVSALREAFNSPHAKAVILRANSPGGSPVQSDDVYREIKRLRQAHPEKPVYAVITDLCASGCYYIISAADQIYANKSSLVGSIGVLMNGFGFVPAMEKIGVERRLLTAGAHKGLLDPFSPINADEKVHMERLLHAVHGHFIDAVKQGRGDRLKDSPDLFSGLIWDGGQAKTMGLIDGFSSSAEVAREVVHAERLVDYTARPDYLQQLAGRLGASMASSLSAHWRGLLLQ